MEDINNVINMPEENKQEFFVADGVRNDSFVKESNGKIGVLSFLFSIFYPIGYFYKQWKAIKKNNVEYKYISPFWRGVFYPFYAFKFTKILDNLLIIKKNKDFSNIANEEEKKKLENEYATFKQFYSNSYFIALVPIVALVLIFCNFIPESFNTGIGIAIWISISMTLRNLQKAIDKILPQDHPKGKLTFSDFLGLPFLVLFLSFFFFEIGGQSCFEVDGNTLKNTCEKYSFTFPFENNKFFEIKDSFGGVSICQAEDVNNMQDNLICIQGRYLDKQDDFDQNKIEQRIATKVDIVSKKTAIYNDNLTYCLAVKSKEKPEKTLQHMCYMRTRDKKFIFGILAVGNEKEMPFENLEKLMNSYKNL